MYRRKWKRECAPISRLIFEPTCIFSLLYIVPKISSISDPYQRVFVPSAQKGMAMGREKFNNTAVLSFSWILSESLLNRNTPRNRLVRRTPPSAKLPLWNDADNPMQSGVQLNYTCVSVSRHWLFYPGKRPRSNLGHGGQDCFTFIRSPENEIDKKIAHLTAPIFAHNNNLPWAAWRNFFLGDS